MYSRSEYHREEDRNRNDGGGWRSWFGLDNKDKDDYHYQKTTTYRNDDRDRDYSRGYGDNNSYTTSRTYVRDADNTGRYGNTGYSGQYDTGLTSGSRGGYGYQTAGEYNRGYGGDRDRQVTSSTYDRDQPSYYRSETRTYGGDRDNYGTGRYGQDSSSRYGYGADSSRYGTTGQYGDSYSRGQYNSSSNNWDRQADYNRSNIGTGDRDRNYGYSSTSRSNW